jgi:FAD:protein FMN transferase
MSNSPWNPLKISILAFSLSGALSFCNALNANSVESMPIKSQYFISQFENVMGTSFEMRVKTSSSKQAALAEKIVLQEVKRLSAILSAYDSNSEFSQWMKTYNVPIKVSPELLEVISLFDSWKMKTKGALNPAAEITSTLWKQAAASQVLPNHEAINMAIQTTNETHWKINVVTQTITHTSQAPLMLNSFVKSYVMEKAIQQLRATLNIEDIVLNVGGDILVNGNSETAIAVANPLAHAMNDAPLDIVRAKDQFIATSGNYKRGHLIQGKWYSHIIDPRTGKPVEEIISATVIAPSATDAGALATAFNVLSIEESKKLAAQYPAAAYLIITKEGERIQSNNWVSVQPEKNLPITSVPLSKGNTWDPSFELIVNLELAKFEGPYRRPFLAIWIEDKDKNSVRTVTVWYNKPRWLKDLRAWHSANYSKFNPESGTISTVSSATRSAGQYAIKWDGKNDKGEYVPTGEYTVKIEVVREHGTYQLYNQDIKVNNKKNKFELAPNTEVAAASIEIKKL